MKPKDSQSKNHYKKIFILGVSIIAILVIFPKHTLISIENKGLALGQINSVLFSTILNDPSQTKIEKLKPCPSDFIKVWTPEDLNNIRNDLDGNYCLMNDIDMSNFGEFEPIGIQGGVEFRGIINGKGHSIKNLQYSTQQHSTYGTAFIGFNDGTIKYLHLKNANINAVKSRSALLVFSNEGTISGCSAEGSITPASNSENIYEVGGLVVRNDEGIIQDSWTNVAITDLAEPVLHYVGGLVSHNNHGSIKNSHSIGNVEGRTYVGGLVGRGSYGLIKDSFATGDIREHPVAGQGIGAGGLVGYSTRLTIENSYATGDVVGYSNVGGLVGRGSLLILRDSYATGNINATSYVGGLVGSFAVHLSRGSLERSWASGDLYGRSGQLSYAGGLVGSFGGSSTANAISDVYATGNVNGGELSGKNGGLIGKFNGEINNGGTRVTNVFSTGDVTGGSNSGGLMGQANSIDLHNSFSTGNVVGWKDNIGGHIGRINGGSNVMSSFAFGDVSSIRGEHSGGCGILNLAFEECRNVGGFAGKVVPHSSRPSTFNNSVSFGDVYSDGNLVGGFVGATGDWSDGGKPDDYESLPIFSNSYSFSDVTGWKDGIGGFAGVFICGYDVQTCYLDNSYSVGKVSTLEQSGNHVGGFVGGFASDGTAVVEATDVYWDTETSGLDESAFGEGKTTEELKEQILFQGWDFENTWIMVDGQTYPLLRNTIGKGVIAHWTMNDIYTDSGKKYTEEEAVFFQDALVNGARKTNGKIDKALSFNNDYLDTNADIDLEQEFSFSTWLKMDNLPEDGKFYVVLSKNNIPTQKSYVMFVYQNKIYFVFYPNTDGSNERLVSAPISKDQWTHIGVTNNKGRLSLYIDGVEKSWKNSTDIVPVNIDTPLIIGAQASGSDYINYYDGIIDDLRIYNRAMSPDEIVVLSNGF